MRVFDSEAVQQRVIAGTGADIKTCLLIIALSIKAMREIELFDRRRFRIGMRRCGHSARCHEVSPETRTANPNAAADEVGDNISIAFEVTVKNRCDTAEALISNRNLPPVHA